MINSWRARQLAVLVWLVVATTTASGSGAVRFWPVPIDAAMTTMALTADGRSLIVACEGADRLLVLDVASDKVVREVKCAAPRSILVRGEQVYVANYGQGTISVFEPGKDWKLTGQLKAGHKNVYHLSAAGGRFFNGQILTTSNDDKKSYCYVVETKANQPRLLSMIPSRQISNSVGCVGAGVLGQGWSNSTTWYPYHLAMRSERWQSNFGGSNSADWISPAPAGDYWLNKRSLYHAPEVHGQKRFGVLSKTMGDVIFPDFARPVVYVISGKLLQAYSVGNPPVLHGQRDVATPFWMAHQSTYDWYDGDRNTGPAKYRSFTQHADKSFAMYPPVATRLGERLYLFTFGPARKQLFRARTEAFALPELADVAGGAPVTFDSATPAVKFEQLDLPHPATTAELSADNRSLIVAFEDHDLLQVLDVASGKLQLQIRCPAPRNILVRGGEVFVANFGKGTISVFRPAEDWKLARTLTVGHKNVYYLSAARGAAYQQRILATCSDGKRSYVYLVNAETGTHRRVAGEVEEQIAVTVWPDGKQVFRQGWRSASSRVLPYEVIAEDNHLVAGARAAGLPMHDWLYAAPVEGLWMTTADAYTWHASVWPQPLRSVVGGVGPVLIPDATRSLVYAVNGRTLDAYRLGDKPGILSSRWAQPPKWLVAAAEAAPGHASGGPPLRLVTRQDKDGSSVFHRSFAVTLDDRLHLILSSPYGRRLYRATTAPFGDAQLALAPPAADNGGAEVAPVDDALAQPLDNEVVEFKPLELERTPTTCTLSGDGKALIVAAEADNELLIVDVVTGRTTRRVPCPSPRYILARGEKVYVANYGKGTISVFEPGADWRQVGELHTGKLGVFCLSAPQGEYFQGRLLASCDASGTPWVIEIDTETGQALRTSEPEQSYMARVSYDGRYILNLRNGTADPWLYARYAGTRTDRRREDDLTSGFIEQFQRGGFWFSPRTLSAGMKSRRMTDRLGAILIPDVSRPLLYALRDDRMEVRRVDGAATWIAERQIEVPEWVSGYLPKQMARPMPHSGGYTRRDQSGTPRRVRWINATHDQQSLILHPTQAVTLDDRLYMFMPAPDCREIFRAATGAFDPSLPAFEQPAEAPLEVKFEPVPTPDVTTSMAMTADGKFLVAAHELSDQLSIWDVLSGRLVKLLPCPSPRFVLCRGGQVFVASFGHGTIRVLSSNDWSVQDELSAGGDDVYYLSAPGGEYFKGELLASCGDARGHQVYLVDTKNDRARPVPPCLPEKQNALPSGIATISFNGESVIEHVLNAYEDRPIQASFRYRDYMKENKRSIRGTSTNCNNGLFYQGRDSNLWFTGRDLATGVPPRVGEKAAYGIDQLHIPDLLRDVFYVYREGEMRCLTLDAARREVEVRPAAPLFDKNDLRKRFLISQTLRYSGDRESLIFTPPIAATHRSETIAYLVSHDTLQLMRCRTRAFGLDAPVVVEADEQDAAGAGQAAVPEFLPPGKLFEAQLTDESATCTLMQGPRGLTVTPTGGLTWTPRAADLGEHLVKVKVVSNGQVSFLRYRVQVVADLAAARRAKPSKDAGRHFVSDDKFHLSVGHDYRSMLLLDGDKLRLLDDDGQKVTKQVKLDDQYRFLFDRKEYYVALQGTDLAVIDKQTLKRRKTIPLGYPKVHDLVLHPTERVCFAAVLDQSQRPDGIETKRVIRIYEDTGQITLLPQVFATYLAMNPTGHYLHTGLHESYRRGYTLDWRLGGLRPAFGDFDVLATYDVRRELVQFVSANLAAGANGIAIRVSPDGEMVSYVSRGGYRTVSGERYHIPGFAAADLRDPIQTYYAEAPPQDIAYHPVLHVVAGANSEKVMTFDLNTGDELEGLVWLGWPKPKEILGLMFAPRGRHLVVSYRDREGRVLVHSAALELTKDHLEVLERWAPTRPRLIRQAPPRRQKEPPTRESPTVVKLIPASKLDALRPAPARRKMTAALISRQYTDSVVLIRTPGGSATGFVVGAEGYVLTCAHGLGSVGDVTVSYRHRRGRTVKTYHAKATIFRVDNTNDLALLQIKPEFRLRPLKLALGTPAETGDPVFIIGHPGLGNTTLNYTMTDGIVSNPRQDLDGVAYLQTTASVNPGSSGAPVFNDYGQVTGLVVLKGRIEAAGFAVPVDRLGAFLKECTKKR